MINVLIWAISGVATTFFVVLILALLADLEKRDEFGQRQEEEQMS